MKKTIVILIVLIVIVTGFIVAYSQEWYPFNPSPEEILNRSFSKMLGLKTCRFEGQIKSSVEYSQESQGLAVENMDITIVGEEDLTDPEKIKSHLDLTVMMGMEGMDVSLQLEGISLGDDKIYLKLVSLPAPISSMLAVFGLDVNSLKDQWILRELEESGVSEEENKEFIDKIKEIFEGKELLELKEVLEDEEINGQMNYHYLVSLDKETIQELIPEFKDIVVEYSKETSLEELSLGEEEEEAFNEFLNKMDERNLLDFEIWIGKKDNYIHKIEIDIGGKLSDLYEEGEISRIENSVFIVDIIFSQFNEEVTIEEPVGAKTLEEIFGEATSTLNQYSPYLNESLPQSTY
jgi:DNA-binding Lrp family transcriptional regulator